VAFVNPSTGNVNVYNYPIIGTDASSPGAPGNAAVYEDGSWDVWSSRDMCFEIYGLGAPEIVEVESTTAFSANEYGWVNVTIADSNGVTNFDDVTLYVNTTGAAQNFTLSWTQSTGLFTEVSDPDGIVELSGSVRENIDIYTDLIGFRFRLAGATTGDCDARVIVWNDDPNNATEDYPELFSYSGVEWDTIGDLINSAFSLFGISGYMTQAINFVTEISHQFTDSITSLVILINLQFQVIWSIFGWFTDWATRIISGAIFFFTVVWNITTGVATGAENIWTEFSVSNLLDVAPLFIICYWIETIYTRGRTQGYTSVLWGDLQNMTNLFAFFMGAFATVIGYIENKIGWLISALT
jgi:hypothetical protein